ncbi:MAG: SAM-dependent methyltransferase [Tissierellia bacterium]|nr:SAM-dependent methyltransferase [Tissierellia bacterium]
MITIVGLGYGDPKALTLRGLETIQKARKVFIRTKDHPTVEYLNQLGIEFSTFDDLYEKKETFEEIYTSIAQRLLEEHQNGDVVYCVPGSPSVAETSVQIIRQRAKDMDVHLSIVEAPSFLEPCFALANVDPVEGFTLLDAQEIHPFQLDTKQHLLITQLWNEFLLSKVKLSLMEIYPEDYEVIALYDAGIIGEERKVQLPLYEMDRRLSPSVRLTMVVPKDDSLPTVENLLFQLREQLYDVDCQEIDDQVFDENIQRLYELLSYFEEGTSEGLWELKDIFSALKVSIFK